jgi:hypothetical protein
MPTMKGAFINLGAGLLGALPNIIVFQFNPERVTRNPALPRPPGQTDGSGTQDANQQPGQPGESISFSLRVDANEQLAQVNPIAVASGVLPTLSALELLMVPKSALTVNLFQGAASGGQPFRNPPEKLDVVLFVWGPWRVLPVAVTSLSITETEYDTRLSPVRADVSVNLQVLTTSQLADNALVARGAYRYSQAVKETMAALNLANSAQINGSMSLAFHI